MSSAPDDRTPPASSPDEEAALAALAPRFLAALQLKDAGRLDEAEDILREILRSEPRLPEPHLELARILLDTDRLDQAEAHAREGLAHLEAGGQWTEDLPAQVVTALAHALLAEVLRRRADEDDVVFGDPDTFRALLEESRAHFEKAAALDPDDSYSSYHAFFLGDPAGAGQVLPGDAGEPSDDADDDGD